MNKIFWYAKVSETLKGCTRIFLALWDQKLSTEKRESPLFIHETFWNQKFSQEEWDSLTKVFGTVRQKKFRIKPWCPVHSYPWKISIKEFFWNTKVFSIELLRYSETKTSTENDDTPPLLPIKKFPYQKVSETQNGSLAKFFRSCEIRIFSTKSWSFPLLCLKLFDARILSKHRRVLLRILSALWDEDFSTELSDITFLCIKFWYTKMFACKMFRYCETTNFL